MKFGRRFVWVLLALAVFLPLGAMAADPTDITGVVNSIDGYRTAAVTVGIAILLYVLGRRVVSKIAK